MLLAEGAPSESFVDDDSRGMFQNAHEFRALYPEKKWTEAVYCAPRVEDGYGLDRIRRRLAERAGITVPPASEFGALHGAIEACDCEGVSGWAQNGAYPEAPVCLDIYVDGEFLCNAYADAGRDNGGRGFSSRFPAALDPYRAHEVLARRSADDMFLGSMVYFAPVAASSSAT